MSIFKKPPVRIEIMLEKSFINCALEKTTEDELVLTYPEQNDVILHEFHEGDHLYLKVYTYDGIYKVDTIVIDPAVNGKVVVDHPSDKEVSRIQRREYFRVSFNTEIVLRNLAEGDDAELITGTTLDLSAGGIRFTTKEPLKNFFSYHASIYLDRKRGLEIEVTGRVLYSKLYESYFGDEYTYINVLELRDIEEKDREKLIQNCFKLQLELRQQGKL